METGNDLNHARQQRLQFIESVALWEGVVDRPRIQRAFGISANHISKDLLYYRERFPENLDYDVSARVYRPSRHIKPQFCTGQAEEYLAILRAIQDGRGNANKFPLPSVEVRSELLPQPVGKVTPTVLREITRAIRQKRGVAIKYQSLSSPDPSKRQIWPHTLVFAGMRWHARAYDDLRNEFRDFVLQRIIEAQPLKTERPIAETRDADWHSFDQVKLVPRSSLSAAQQEVIAREFGMKEGETGWIWSHRVRYCLIPYLLSGLQLTHGHPAPHPYICLDDPALAERHQFKPG